MSSNTKPIADTGGTTPEQAPGQATGQAPEPPPYARRRQMLPVLLAAMFMVQFDLFVVNVAAPSLGHDIHAGQAALELIVAGYGFTYAAGLVTGGRLGDLLGARVMFLGGTLAFTAASLLCGLAQNSGELVAARLVQGLTGAAMVPQVLALITGTFPPAERPRALGWFGVALGTGGVAGQVLGGALLQGDVLGLGWRVIFLVNVPIGLVVVLLALRLLPVQAAGGRPRLDPVGAVGISGSLALALIPLVLGRSQGWPVWGWVMLAASVPAMVLSLCWEAALGSRGGQPLLDLALFRNAVFTRGLIVSVGVFAAFYSFMFSLTLVLQSGLGLSPLHAGYTSAPLAVAFATASMIGPRKVRTYGPLLVTAGILIAGVGMAGLIAVLAVSGSDTSAARLIGPMVLVGFGNGLAVPVLAGVILAGARTVQAGAAAGVLTTTQQFASVAGVAGIGTVFFGALGSHHDVLGFAHALEWVLGIGLVLLLVAGLTTLRLPRPPKPTG
jgi:MFS family permease